MKYKAYRKAGDEHGKVLKSYPK